MGVQMSPNAVRALRRLEGRHVSLRLSDGSQIHDCELVSAGRRGAATLWVHDGSDDRFIQTDEVVDLHEVS